MCPFHYITLFSVHQFWEGGNIEIDEKGTEAAAVTSIGMAGSSLPPQPIDVKFNEPFTFVIRDNISGEVLFLGEFSFAK